MGSSALVARVGLPILLAVIAWGCGRDPEPPPIPTQTRVPTVIGRVAGFAADGLSYQLQDGTKIRLDGPGVLKAERLSAAGVVLPADGRPGGLLLFGEDDIGRFYAATLPTDLYVCDVLQGQGYIEADRVHLSSGLAVPFAPDMARDNPRDPRHTDPTWLLDFDRICVDEEGRVTSIHQLPLGT